VELLLHGGASEHCPQAMPDVAHQLREHVSSRVTGPLALLQVGGSMQLAL
jgi:hypothetical protein